ncbi:hypothetical protein [Sinorhizobium fredii]|uniref:hypothetical protein n=1 Tax=Rhizobium fredii TaxID=380 RepID=UPI0035172940
MAKGGRKGPTRGNDGSGEKENQDEALDKGGVINESYRGQGVVDTFTISLDEFHDVNIIWKYRSKVFHHIFHARSRASHKTYLHLLRIVATYWRSQQKNLGKNIDIPDLSPSLTNGFTLMVDGAGNAEKIISFFNRVLKAVGVDDTLLIANPYTKRESAPKRTMTEDEFRNALHRANSDADIVRNRFLTLATLRNTGIDPGLDESLWSSEANRIWYLEHKIGLHLPKWDDLYRLPEFSKSIKLISGFPGAPSFDSEGKLIKKPGYFEHVRWFYPAIGDLVPFVGLLLARTPLNVSAIMAARVGEQSNSPYYFNVTNSPSEHFVFVWWPKTRGRHDPLAEPKLVSTISPIKPRSYPYQVRLFVEELTAELRKEVRRRIEMLARTGEQAEELQRLRSIENDLFLYRTEQGINSLRAASLDGNLPEGLSAGLKNYGITARDTRGSNLVHSYNASGQKLWSIHALAGHRDLDLAILYARRDAAIDKVECLFRDIFNHSLNLIEVDAFDTERLRLILTAQGLSKRQVSNLLSKETRTRWGNRCANPKRPPPGFDRRTPPGEDCREQNCIDGCSNGRWFSDSSHVVDELIETLQSKRDSQPFLATVSGTLNSRIDRLLEISRALASVR